MKSTLLFLCIFLLLACFRSEPIDQSAIKIARINQHPFLVDHCKKLLIINSKKEILDEMPMYCDPGEGCNSHLFDVDTSFVLIDCNGQWYFISKQKGKITKAVWQWEKELPAKYMGTFFRAGRNEYYSLQVEEQTSIATVYQFKDPGQ